MATKIKRCLYVGLGGTGMNSLLHTKKMFIDTYGEVPPMIGFLGIDTDGGAYKKSLTALNGDDVNLSPNEQSQILVDDARPIYDVNKVDFAWVPSPNLYALTSMKLGAGQVRSNGRFAFTVNYVRVAQKVQTILNNITNAHIINNDKYELLSAETEIHMVFSVCGGTGCGTFINMAYLLRKEAPQCKLTGYAVLPDVFKSMAHAGMAKVAANAYGAIVDLDYLMHMGIGSTPVKLEYIKDVYNIRERPFNSVVFIDNKNDNLDAYTHVDELSEMISLALVTAAGELSSASASVSDNLEKNIREGSMDIENKKAWAAGMGACEILYRGNEISKIYSIKAAKLLIERLFNSCEDADVIVNAWIDSQEVNIRENNGNDNVIDYLYDKVPKYDLTINDNGNAMPEVETYLNSVAANSEKLNERTLQLTSRVKEQLRNLLERHINKECGISTAENIIAGIQAQVEIFLGEMKSEKEQLVDNEPRYKASIETAVADLSDYDKKFFKKSGKLDDLANDVVDAAKQLAVCRLEIARRTYAITVFNNIQNLLLQEKGRVMLIGERLKAVSQKLTLDLAKIQNGVDNVSQTFQIDLAQSALKTVSVKPEEIQYADFASTLNGSGKILGFSEMDSNEIEKAILGYTSSLHTAKSWKNRTIDEVIDSMPDDEFSRLVDLSIKKSMPLFRYNYRGYQPKESPCDSFYIGVPNKKTNRLMKDNNFKNKVASNADVDFASIGDNTRIIVYRQVGVVPAYAISSINEYKKEYDSCPVSCYIDETMHTRMEREEFSLTPHRQTDEDLLDFWVKGLIFGLIKNDAAEGYMFQSQQEGDPLDDFWLPIGKYRDEAFDEFCRHKASVRKEFSDTLESMVVNQGAEAINAKLQDAKANYLSKYSQINMTKDQIRARGNEKIEALLREELVHVKSI